MRHKDAALSDRFVTMQESWKQDANEGIRRVEQSFVSWESVHHLSWVDLKMVVGMM